MIENKDKLDKIQVSLAAINPYIEVNIQKPIQELVKGKDFVKFGETNTYPNYIEDIIDNCSTLTSIIYGSADFVIGDDIITNKEIINKKGETLRDIIYKCAVDYFAFGGYYLQVIRDTFGNPVEIYWLDYKHVRTNAKNDIFFYSEDWNKSFGRVQYLVYPKYIKDGNATTSIIYVKNQKCRGIYATPLWQSAIKSALIENKINDYHLNGISNGFAGSYIVNFNNGIPNDEVKDEIEESINEKFSGSENAGRILISFNDSKERAVDVQKLEVDDFGEKYNTLAKRSREQLYGVFGATPALFGVMTETTGFNTQEFAESFKLYNRTRIQPVQQTIVDSLNKIWGDLQVEIKPFNLNNNTEENVD